MTISMAMIWRVASGELAARDYVIGESHAVTGPRAYIRTKDYVFSLQTRPDKSRGNNMDWAMNAATRNWIRLCITCRPIRTK